MRLPRAARLRRAYLGAATPGYLGSLVLVTALLLAVPLAVALASEGSTLALIFVGLAALGSALDLAIALVNRAVTSLVGPRALPRLELVDGVPSELRTLVVVPTLLANQADVEEQVAGLEIHFLANPAGDVVRDRKSVV